MSESSKLKNLSNKTKPSIQFEVRKKKPNTTTEFLEYAKEAEELLQLSNITSENVSSVNSSVTTRHDVPPLLPDAAINNNQSSIYL